jgi:hypothetical protein
VTFFLKRNDTAPSIRATLKDGSDAAVNLTGATVKFHMRTVFGNTTKIDATANIIAPETNGVVQYNWTTADTNTPGTFFGEFEVTHSDGTVETFPNNSFVTVEVTEDIT